MLLKSVFVKFIMNSILVKQVTRNKEHKKNLLDGPDQTGYNSHT